MTAVEVLGSVDELADGTAGSVDAATGAAIGQYRKSRLNRLFSDSSLRANLASRARSHAVTAFPLSSSIATLVDFYTSLEET